MIDPAVSFIPNFSWVLPGRLAASGLPARGTSWEAPRAYAQLHAVGIRVVASLLESPQPVSVIEGAGLLGLNFPIGDFGTPRDPQAFGRFVDAVHAHIEAGRPALVHCYAGIGRAGMFVASYLARHGGLTAEEAVGRVRALRPGSIETPGQVQIVQMVQGAPSRPAGSNGTP